ncbi:hypothetical protein [Mesorhizobium sp. A623]
MTPQHFEIMQIAFEMASDSIMGKGNFHAEFATNSMRILLDAAAHEEVVEAAQAVLDALDDLKPLVHEGRRSRAWQDQKLFVQDAFSRFDGIYEKRVVSESAAQL